MSEFKGDKRTKEFRDWKKNHAKASEGLGDTVQKITKATGIIKMAVDTKKNKFTPDEQETFKNIYERIFKTKVECTPCSFAKVVWKDLNAVYNQYL